MLSQVGLSQVFASRSFVFVWTPMKVTCGWWFFFWKTETKRRPFVRLRWLKDHVPALFQSLCSLKPSLGASTLPDLNVGFVALEGLQLESFGAEHRDPSVVPVSTWFRIFLTLNDNDPLEILILELCK